MAHEVQAIGGRRALQPRALFSIRPEVASRAVLTLTYIIALAILASWGIDALRHSDT